MPSETFWRLVERLRNDRELWKQVRERPLAFLAEYDLADDERIEIILPNFRWLITGRLAGVSRPRSDDALATLRTLGVKALLTLTEEPPHHDRLAAYDLLAVHLPIADFTAPTLDQVRQAVATIDNFLEAARPVAVHCAGGLGRTGTILACYLVARGTSAADAIRQVREQRHGSIETSEQEAIVRMFERAVKE